MTENYGNAAPKVIVSAVLKKRVTSPLVKAWRGPYCCVPLCHSSSGENTEGMRLGLPAVPFHCFPDPKTMKGKEWIKKYAGIQGLTSNLLKVLKFAPCISHQLTAFWVNFSWSFGKSGKRGRP